MTEPTMLPLEPVTEDWQRALAVVAHPDDLEFGAAAPSRAGPARASGSPTASSPAGRRASTGSRPSAPGRSGSRSSGTRRRSSGSTPSSSSGCPTASWSTACHCDARSPRWCGGTGPRSSSRRTRDVDGAYALNQADHIATGRAVLDAVRDAGNRWVFPEQLTDGLERWAGVRQVWAAASPLAGHGVDVTDTFDRGWPRCGRTRRTWPGWATAASTPRSSWRGSRGRPAPGSASATASRSRCSASTSGSRR